MTWCEPARSSTPVSPTPRPGGWLGANTLADLRGWTRFVGLQIEYSLIERTVERELLPMAKALGMTVTAWSPLAGGVLSGKYQGGSQAKDARYSNEMMKHMQATGEQTDRIVAAVKHVSQQTGRSAAQIAIAWLLHRDQPIIPIIGTRKMPQLQDNLAALDVKLTGDQLQLLDRAMPFRWAFRTSSIKTKWSAISSMAGRGTRSSCSRRV